MNKIETKAAALAVASLAFASFGTTFSAPAAAATLIFDRGLPTANLNNVAGANRSNVAWADGTPTASMGDNFALSGSSYAVDTIRVWVVSSVDLSGSQNAFQLSFGSDSGAATALTSPAYSSTSVTSVLYSDATSYQGTSGTYRYLYQVDFGSLGVTLAPGTFAFGVSGPAGYADPNHPEITYTPFLHASNAFLSGSTQTGSDGSVYGFSSAGLMVNGYPWDSTQGGWDKNSDINVQVYGAPVPLPAAAWLLLSGLAGLGVIGRRRTAA